ncbi:serine/threonine-protein kinase [Calothrix sp. PCC 6303]|uniref:serine/threonine-protein kinase n=1 Tax=Calothrix sp. PCC 6303 TaxID=1170562 RepID=UPI0002A03F6D|nr:serine/threonine-protein kinase [Calothrix sp. PCC 6303]AFZ00808.1 serine/threonine protein kinase [Calothrix sp. PCC 6303]
MEVYCTRPQCPRPQNNFQDLDDNTTLRHISQKYCTSCGMPLFLAGRYIPTKLLGKGGFGAAFLARDRYTPGMKKCVVKQFQPAVTLSPDQLQLAQNLFEREATVLEEIGAQHDQIPELFAYFPVSVESSPPGHKDQFFYLVQEYIDGQNLEEEFAQNGNFSESEAVEVLREVLKVLEFVHFKNIIHRDIKPSNIMRDRTGKLYLLDFGAVKQVTNSPSLSSTPSTGIYSLGFAPPEQMAGGQVFPSTDLYALGVTIITLMSGKPANELFDSGDNEFKWRSHVKIKPRLADILDKMLLSAANQRFQSAAEVLRALDNSATPTAQSSQSKIQPFSTVEMLTGAAFCGFQGGLIAIVLFSLLKSAVPAVVIASLITVVLVILQRQRIVDGSDLLIIPGITFGIILFIPLLHGSITIPTVILVAVAAALVAIAITSLFRLIYNLLSQIL